MYWKSRLNTFLIKQATHAFSKFSVLIQFENQISQACLNFVAHFIWFQISFFILFNGVALYVVFFVNCFLWSNLVSLQQILIIDNINQMFDQFWLTLSQLWFTVKSPKWSNFKILHCVQNPQKLVSNEY